MWGVVELQSRAEQFKVGETASTHLVEANHHSVIMHNSTLQ